MSEHAPDQPREQTPVQSRPAEAAVARYLAVSDTAAIVPDAVRARGYEATVAYLRMVEKSKGR